MTQPPKRDGTIFPWDLDGYDCLDWVDAMLKKFAIVWCVEWGDGADHSQPRQLLIRCRNDEDVMRPAIFSKRSAAHKVAQEMSRNMPNEPVTVCKFRHDANGMEAER